MSHRVMARPNYVLKACGVTFLISSIVGCVSSDRARSVSDAMRWDAVHVPLPTVREYKQADDAKLPTLDDSAGLEDYLAYAALNNPGLEAVFNLWKAAFDRPLGTDKTGRTSSCRGALGELRYTEGELRYSSSKRCRGVP